MLSVDGGRGKQARRKLHKEQDHTNLITQVKALLSTRAQHQTEVEWKNHHEPKKVKIAGTNACAIT